MTYYWFTISIKLLESGPPENKSVHPYIAGNGYRFDIYQFVLHASGIPVICVLILNERCHTSDRSCADHLQIISTSWPRPFRADRYIPDLYDLYDLAHVAGWEPYNPHDLGHVSWVRSMQKVHTWYQVMFTTMPLNVETILIEYYYPKVHYI